MKYITLYQMIYNNSSFSQPGLYLKLAIDNDPRAITIGRAKESLVRVPQTMSMVSKNHGVLYVQRNEVGISVMYKDFNSTNGTLLLPKGKSFQQATYLKDSETIVNSGDTIIITDKTKAVGIGYIVVIE